MLYGYDDMVAYRSALGQPTRTAVLSCPHCSYLVEGECVICEDDDPHPACQGCVGGRLPPLPWYKTDLFVSIMTATVVSIASAIIVAQVKKRTKLSV